MSSANNAAIFILINIHRLDGDAVVRYFPLIC